MVDPVTQDVVNYDIYGTFGRASRVIYMDGRARPSANAAHTFAGFSLGKWEGGILSVETTHLKAGYLRRNGIIHSDMATMTEHFIRHGEHLTIVTICSRSRLPDGRFHSQYRLRDGSRPTRSCESV